MGRIWVREFTGGLDTRRMAATTPGGVLVQGSDGHITSGGEFEQRAAFVSTYDLPADSTVGLAQTSSGLVVFGSDDEPDDMPSGVTYQQLQHSDGSTAIDKILSTDLYGGKLYVVAQFTDGSIFHYYDGTRVTDWFDGRARTSFRVTGGGVTTATKAVGSFEVTGGSEDTGNEITSVKIDGVDILTGPIAHTGSNDTTASAVATAINSLDSDPNYTAAATGQTVTITASATGPAANGKTIVIVDAGDVTTGNVVNMAGGADAATSSLGALKVNGVNILGSSVDWTTSNEATAMAIAAEVNSETSDPDYDATAVGDQVNIIAADSGDTPNGYAVTFDLEDGLTVTPTSGLELAGGVTSDAFVPGTFVKTVGSKIYSVAGSVLHFSGIDEPTKWTTDTTGAGFTDMAKESSGAEKLTAVANYQGFLAIFAGPVVLIYFVDPDPNLNNVSQILGNTGTNYPRSVTGFGDSDLFYLAESGCRSLRARDASNSASTTDIGVPVDTLIRAQLRKMTAAEKERIAGFINPADGRFWLCMNDIVFVFSFFANAKVSAWTTYNPGFDIEAATIYSDKVYVRSGDTIYAYGGTDTDLAYDGTVCKAYLPFLDADKPTESKDWNGFDAAVEGNWSVYAGMEVTNIATRELIATITETTFNKPRHPFNGQSTHCSLQFEGNGNSLTEPARLSAAVLHYDDGEDG